MVARVKGGRTCRKCKGICHEHSWRERIGERKGYWCSERCLRADQEIRYNKTLRERIFKKWHKWVPYDDDYWVEYRDRFWERVEVICR